MTNRGSEKKATHPARSLLDSLAAALHYAAPVEKLLMRPVNAGFILVMLGIMFAMCFAKGEPPRWRWGDRDISPGA
jgi:hypothetical protein